MSDLGNGGNGRDNSFLAILNATTRKQIIISAAEHELLKHARRITSERKHCKIMIEYRDGKLYLYEVLLITALAGSSAEQRQE